MDEKQSTIRFEHIHWRSFLQVNSRKKADVLLQRIGNTLGTSLELQRCERYWKDATLYEVAFLTPLHIDDIAQATFATLCVVRNLAYHWTISGPHAYIDDGWDFSGYVSQARIPGAMFTEFSITNIVHS